MTSHTGSSIRSWLADVKYCLYIFLSVFSFDAADAQNIIRKVSPFEIGQYDSSGMPVGIWNYYDKPDTLALTINYSNFQLIYLNIPTVYNYVLWNDNWAALPMKRPARYVGSLAKAHESLQPFFFSFFGESYFKKDDINDYIIWISFTVNQEGKVCDLQVDPSLPEKPLNNLHYLLEKNLESWIPAIFRNSEVPSRFTIPIGLCQEDCDAFENLKAYQITEHGQILFKVGFRKSKIIRINLRPYSELQRGKILSWTFDGKNILYYDTEQARLNKINLQGEVEELILFDRPHPVQCLNKECSSFLINFFLNIDNSYCIYNSKYNQLSYINSLDYSDRILTVPETEMIYFSRNSSKQSYLISLNRNNNKQDTVASCHECIMFPISSKQHMILYSEKQSGSSMQKIIVKDLANNTSKQLPLVNAFFHDWTSDGHYLLFEKTDMDSGKSKLYTFNLNTSETNEVCKLSSYTDKGFFGNSPDLIYFTSGNNLYKLNISERNAKPKKLLTNVLTFSISPDRKSIVLKLNEKKQNRIFLYEPDKEEKLRILLDQSEPNKS